MWVLCKCAVNAGRGVANQCTDRIRVHKNVSQPSVGQWCQRCCVAVSFGEFRGPYYSQSQHSQRVEWRAINHTIRNFYYFSRTIFLVCGFRCNSPTTYILMVFFSFSFAANAAAALAITCGFFFVRMCPDTHTQAYTHVCAYAIVSQIIVLFHIYITMVYEYRETSFNLFQV